MKKCKLFFVAATMAMALMMAFAGCSKDQSNDNDPMPVATKTYFTVTFDSNGGSEVVPDSIPVLDGYRMTEPQAPTKAGCMFTGWFTDNGTFVDKWDFATSIVTSDITLYAQWAAGEIRTAADLNAVRNFLSGSYVLMNDIDLSGYPNWLPIGTYDTPFIGTFNGNGHKITGLTAKWPTSDCAGLFGYLSGNGSVSDLGVEIGAGGIIGSGDVGGIAGRAGVIIHWMVASRGATRASDICTITNCYTTGGISGDDAGGIAGYVEGCIITNCYTTGNVSASNASGGIAGAVEGGGIVNCYSTGNVSSTSAYYYSGGIVGWASCMVTGCAAVNPAINSSGYAGRIAGYVGSGTISNNFALDAMAVTGDTSNGSNGADTPAGDFTSQSTYQSGLGWKFGNDDANPWKMPAGGGYPVFYWQ